MIADAVNTVPGGQCLFLLIALYSQRALADFNNAECQLTGLGIG